MQNNNEQRMKRPLKNKIILSILFIVFAIDICCIAFNYSKFVRLNNTYTTELARTVINTCTLIIDGDRMEDYLETRKRDTDYYAIWNKLIDYRNTNKAIMKLSVVSFRENGCYYIFDTDLSDNGAFLGDLRAYDTTQKSVKDALMNFTMDKSLEYGTHTDIYVPIKSSYNIPVAYVVAGISVDSIKKEQEQYLIWLAMIVTGVAFVFGILLIFYMNRSIITPINMMTSAAVSYAKNLKEDSQTSPLQQLSIQTGDELERLCESLKTMENDILISSVNLVNATWNSNHDSMTQLYNKRYYWELLPQLENEKNIGVIYMDIDNLKLMNDRCGHDLGDEVIMNAADLIHNYEIAGAECCRVGGDEFVMIIRNTTLEEVDDLVVRLREDKNNVLSNASKEFVCRLAVGGAFRLENESIGATIKNAEQEMYKNKHAKR